MEYLKTGKYDRNFIKENMMGPNCMKILEELMESVPLRNGMLVLDLGCGNGLTSIFWPEEALATWHSMTWLENIFKKSKHFEVSQIKEMQGFDEVWTDWLETDNIHAIEDKSMIKADNGRYMNLIAIVGKNKLTD